MPEKKLSWFGVQPEEMDLWWERAKPFVARALAEGRGEYAAADVCRFLDQRAMQLWLLWDGSVRGAVVTELCNYPCYRTCIVRLFAADRAIRDAWLPMLGIIEAWARTQDCEAIEVIGRPGWKRVLSGYEQTHLVLRKDL